jgi:hypothetical protein
MGAKTEPRPLFLLWLGAHRMDRPSGGWEMGLAVQKQNSLPDQRFPRLSRPTPKELNDPIGSSFIANLGRPGGYLNGSVLRRSKWSGIEAATDARRPLAGPPPMTRTSHRHAINSAMARLAFRWFPHPRSPRRGDDDSKKNHPALVVGRGNRQMFDRLEAWPLAPLNLGFFHRQLQFRPTPEQGLQRTCSLDARELMA